MSKKLVLSGISLLALFVSGAAFVAPGKSGAVVDYPEGYRAWPHVKSMVLQQGHPLFDTFGGLHHIYANAKALEAMKAGKPYPEGAVLVFDLCWMRNPRTLQSSKARARWSV